MLIGLRHRGRDTMMSHALCHSWYVATHATYEVSNQLYRHERIERLTLFIISFRIVPYLVGWQQVLIDDSVFGRSR